MSGRRDRSADQLTPEAQSASAPQTSSCCSFKGQTWPAAQNTRTILVLCGVFYNTNCRKNSLVHFLSLLSCNIGTKKEEPNPGSHVSAVATENRKKRKPIILIGLKKTPFTKNKYPLESMQTITKNKIKQNTTNDDGLNFMFFFFLIPPKHLLKVKKMKNQKFKRTQETSFHIHFRSVNCIVQNVAICTIKQISNKKKYVMN